ncbi:MAG: ABC-type transport auxiliary lipoprotein family protein [Pseudomonas sp.]
MIRLTLASGLLAGLLTLSACTLIPESEALAVYQFPQPAQSARHHLDQPPAISLRIDTPHTGYAYSGPRLMVQTRNNQLLSYKGVRWSDPTPILLREYLALAFQRQGALSTVTTDEKALYADVHLGSDLRRFQVVDSNDPHILIELQARLINPESRRIYVSQDFSIRQSIDSTQIQHVTEGYEQASAALATQLLGWAIPQLSAISRN